MRRVISVAAAILAVGLAQEASAADFPSAGPRIAPLMMAAPVPMWTGPYVGVTAGYAFGRSRHCDPPGSGFCTSAFDVDGAALGATLGYNYQVGTWVFGVETDLSWSNAEGSTGSSPSYGCAGTCRTSLDWFGTVRGRVGPAFNNVLFYATGGLAYGDLHASAGTPTVIASDSIKTGWTVGVGAEYAFSRNWSVKAEYLYFDLGKLSYGTTPTCAVNCAATKNNFNLLRAGVNYRF
jgi:outer membrane immunogenic protein